MPSMPMPSILVSKGNDDAEMAAELADPLLPHVNATATTSENEMKKEPGDEDGEEGKFLNRNFLRVKQKALYTYLTAFSILLIHLRS